MKQFIAVTLFIILIFLLNIHPVFAQKQNGNNQAHIASEQGSNLNEADTSLSSIVFQCQIDLEVLSNSSIYCSKCGLKLKEYTMGEVFDNLAANGYVKPNLKIRNVLMVEAEVDTLIEEIIDTSAQNDNIPEIDFVALDHDENGQVYQCPNDPDMVSDDQERCAVCDALYKEVPIEEAKSMLRAAPIQEAEANSDDEANVQNSKSN